MTRIAAALLTLLITTQLPLAAEVSATLRGSRASMQRQNRIARAEDFSFLRTPAQVSRFAGSGYLVEVPDGEDYRVLASWPYARPVVRDFVGILAAGYRAACGERLVVTSLTRPSGQQPGNASPLSVHPAGMAVDLRVSQRAACVDWLEAELLRLEADGRLDATREFRPPHFHVAVFPESFAELVAARAADSARLAEAEAAAAADVAYRQASVLTALPTLSSLTEPPRRLAVLDWPAALLATVARLLLRA